MYMPGPCILTVFYMVATRVVTYRQLLYASVARLGDLTMVLHCILCMVGVAHSIRDSGHNM